LRVYFGRARRQQSDRSDPELPYINKCCHYANNSRLDQKKVYLYDKLINSNHIFQTLKALIEVETFRKIMIFPNEFSQYTYVPATSLSGQSDHKSQKIIKAAQ